MNEKPRSDINLERFEKWQEIVSDNIQDFLSTLPDSISTKLDNSIESLSIMGNWLIEQYPDFNNSLKTENSLPQIHRGLMYYVGEVYCKYLGGHWNVHFKEIEPDYEYGQEPVIEGFHHDVALCPYFEVLVTLSKNESERLKNVLIDFMKLYKRSNYVNYMDNRD